MSIRIGESKEDFLARERERDAKRRVKNKEKIKEYQIKYRSEQVVYTHTNSKGEVYIGSGGKYRPYNMKIRSKAWFKAFKNDCVVKVIRAFNNAEDARRLEKSMINCIGLENLINQRC